MTTGHTFAFPQRISPGSCMSLPSQERGRRECRVFGCTRSPVCKCRKHTSVVTADEAETSTFPAQWFGGLLRALPGVHDLLVTVACRSSLHCRLSTSPGAPGPHAFAA